MTTTVQSTLPSGYSRRREGKMTLDFIHMLDAGVVFVEAFGLNALGQKVTRTVKFGAKSSAPMDSIKQEALARLVA